jgi:uncharacterized membrane protein YdjX (TVP38/TMEM64 family)
MNKENFKEILNWIKTHRFWTSVIVLWSLHLALSFFPLNLLDMVGTLEYIFSSQFLGYYTIIGGIAWSLRQKKPGYSLISLGIGLLLVAFNIPVKFYVYTVAGLEPYTDLLNYVMLSAAFICGAVFLYFGNRRYKQPAYFRSESEER